ncbi:radical SAM protein [Candidatus Woesearchaeota archaeon]|nr:radical SAM protein [Candidatus Woesearchaeota archaeon]
MATAQLAFKDLSFEDDGDKIIVRIMQNFSFSIEKEALKKIAPFQISRQAIQFADISEKKANNKFNRLLAEHIQTLRNVANQRPSLYLHRYSGVPLMGSLAIGMVDKGSNIIEVKPLTSCNIGCLFCSVDEGIGSKKRFFYIIEEEYLVQELKKLLDYKQNRNIFLYLNPHGEPLMYSRIVDLVADIKGIHWVKHIAIITNGSLLTEKLIDDLAAAGLTHLNISMNAYSREMAHHIANTKGYDIERVKKMAAYAAKKYGRVAEGGATIDQPSQNGLALQGLKVILTPVWMDGVNDADIEKVIEFGKDIGAALGIQKFCYNKRGRNPVKEISWEEFYAKLKALEQKHQVRLVHELKVEKTKELPQPFHKWETINAEIICRGRNPGEFLCKAKERLVTITKCQEMLKQGEIVKVKVTRDKYNVFFGQLVGY